jgi:hypothetical protein
MATMANPLQELTAVLEQRLSVVGALAESLEASQWALGRKDAEAIVRGATHQAELCRRWSLLEEHLEAEAMRRMAKEGDSSNENGNQSAGESADQKTRSTELAAEWEALVARIRYLVRVHSSLLRHMQRSLEVWNRVMTSCSPMYAPAGDGAHSDLPRWERATDGSGRLSGRGTEGD